MRRVSDVVPFVPEELDALVARMVSRDPGARPANGAEVAIELSRIAEPSYFDEESVTRIRAAPQSVATGTLVMGRRR